MKKISKVSFIDEPELENFVFDNLDSYFSQDRIFISDKKMLITKTGKGTLPDGILFDIEKSKICLIKNELLEHGVFNHIVKQIIRFLVAYKNKDTKVRLKIFFLMLLKKNFYNYK